jgi:hypothetical protein
MTLLRVLEFHDHYGYGYDYAQAQASPVTQEPVTSDAVPVEMAEIKGQQKEEEEGEDKEEDEKGRKEVRKEEEEEETRVPAPHKKSDFFFDGNRFLKNFGPAGPFKGRRFTLERERANQRKSV